jgi:hypothetical protein
LLEASVSFLSALEKSQKAQNAFSLHLERDFLAFPNRIANNEAGGGMPYVDGSWLRDEPEALVYIILD